MSGTNRNVQPAEDSSYAGHSHLLRRNLDEHMAIAHAITDHDAPEARALMLAHCRNATQNTARWLETPAHE